MDKPHSMSRSRKWLVSRNNIIHAITHVTIHKIFSCLIVCHSILVVIEKPQPIVSNQYSGRATRKHYWGNQFVLSLTLTCFKYKKLKVGPIPLTSKVQVTHQNYVMMSKIQKYINSIICNNIKLNLNQDRKYTKTIGCSLS